MAFRCASLFLNARIADSLSHTVAVHWPYASSPPSQPAMNPGARRICRVDAIACQKKAGKDQSEIKWSRVTETIMRAILPRRSRYTRVVRTVADSAEKDALLQRLARLSPDSPRQWGRMSPHQAVCHLSDSFKVITGERRAKAVDTILSRTLFRFVALNTALPWPRGVPTGEAVDQERGGSRPVEFARDVEELRTLIERFAASPRDFAFQPHPFLGACRRAYAGRKVGTAFVPAHQMSGLRIQGAFRVAFPA
jgi:hypothetical protein